MPTAFTRLWRRAPLWRAAFLVAVPATLLSALYPVTDPRFHRRDRLLQEPAFTTARSGLAVPPPLAADSGPAVATPAPKHMLVELREAEFRDSSAPYYLVPDWIYDTGYNMDAIAAQEVASRPTFSGTAPFTHREIPLPPGTWTVISLGPEHPSSRMPAASGVLLARLDGHEATGFVLVRGSVPGSVAAAPLPPNPMCVYPRRYARVVLASPREGNEECWFIAKATFPGVAWNMVVDPPALGLALKTSRQIGDHLPVCLVGMTYFHATGRAWIEVTYFSDPFANDVREGGPFGGWEPQTALTDPTLISFVTRFSAWTRQMLPLLHNPGPTPPPASVLAAANRNSPE